MIIKTDPSKLKIRDSKGEAKFTKLPYRRYLNPGVLFFKMGF